MKNKKKLYKVLYSWEIYLDNGDWFPRTFGLLRVILCLRLCLEGEEKIVLVTGKLYIHVGY